MPSPEKLNILIVDDKKENLLAMAGLLEDFDVNIVTSTSGNDALAKVLKHDFVIVLMDVQMPVMDGFETASIMHTQVKTPIIFVTAIFPEKKYISKGYEAGAVDYLLKPIDPEILRSKVRVFLDLHEQKILLENEIKVRKQVEEKLEKSLKEKEILMKEIHHRVKNNMNVVISLLSIQSRHIKEKKYIAMFEDCQNRIKSMVLVHEQLYQSKDLSNIDFKAYIKDFSTSMFRNYGINKENIALKTKIEETTLGIDKAIPCGLVINELISNSLKYAFPDNRKGKIEINLMLTGKNNIELVIQDDGIGIPKDVDYRNTKSLGMQLVTNLVKQIGGTIELDRKEGTKFSIKIKR